MKRSDFVLFLCLILCAVAVVHTQQRARRVFVDLEREKTAGDALAADLRRLQSERATLIASNRVEHVASEMKMHLPDTRSVIVMGNQIQDLAQASSANASVTVASVESNKTPLALPEPQIDTSAVNATKAKQPVRVAKRAKP